MARPERLSQSEIARRLATLPGWTALDQGLHRVFTFRDFVDAFAFMTAAAHEAEALGHHPDWSNAYNRVTVDLITHEAGGITASDFALAARLDALAAEPAARADRLARASVSFAGRVAVVTGGAGALGQSICRRLLEAGATVCVPHRGAEGLEALRRRLGEAERARLHAAPADLSDETPLAAFVAGVLERHHRVDILVNAVGGFAGGDLASTPLPEWEHMLRLNLISAVVGCRAVLPPMLAAGHGRIVNIASRAVVPPAGGFIAYTVAKAAVITLTQALAEEGKGRGIAVNAVLPGTMDTPANRAAMPRADRSAWVSTDAVAGVVAYLASDEAGAISGACIPV
ncbi:MAG: 4a-hydroxytetrahydrobiopterin dehydratase [Candidatus Rokubacteria bacterium]|nr:4a-hydroxytetrahydrobiopterin dehydratase [Candidatus Rokubacteria bacterium]MBI2524350.1 4a-hydroxytetrahydrobiopterin dehydratase [Candidatus Rokubacteria bacterium]